MLSKRTNKIIVLALLAYLILITYTILSAIKAEMRPGITIDAESFIYMFELVQPFGVYDGFLLTGTLLILPIIGSFVPIFVKNNNELNNVVQRIGYGNFLKKSVCQTFIVGLGFSFISQIYEIILINWNYAPIAFSNDSFYLAQRFNTFSNNSFIQLLTYIVTSSIGWGIFSVFIFACGLYIKKNPLFIVSGAVLGLILLLLPTLYGMMNYFLYAVANVTEISTLIAPGMIDFASQKAPGGIMIIWIISAILYALIAWILIMTWQKKQLRGK
ncbi:MAG: hypothetical protein N4Q11_02690 [Lactobacillus iners]|nr:hypothetical protein [Lactobacillus iners]